MKVLFAILVLITTLLPGSRLPLALAQDPILVKPFDRWTRADAKKILNDSPWATMQ